MRAAEIFGRVSTHMVEGMMMHDQMADAYAFLALPKLSALHERRFEEETESMRHLHRYMINHFNMLLEEGHPSDPHALPNSWHGYTRQQVTAETKRKAVRELMEHWVKWERETKRCYEKAYMDLVEIGEIAAAMRMKKLICDVDEELEHAEIMHLRMDGFGYEMNAVESIQAEIKAGD